MTLPEPPLRSRFSAIGLAWTLVAVVCIGYLVRCSTFWPLDFDSAYNLQVAKSLAGRFVYTTLYQPAFIYDARITTNGPIQYVVALFLLLSHDIDLARYGIVAMIAATFFTGLYALRAWLVGLGAVVLMFWPVLFNTAISFLGDLFAVGCTLIGIALYQRAFSESRGFGSIVRDRRYLAACVFFAGAISTKLMALVWIAPILIALSAPLHGWRRARTTDETLQERALMVLFAISISFVLFALQFSVSYLHSVRNWSEASAVFNAFHDFIASHAGQAESRRGLGATIAAQVDAFGSKSILWLWVAAMILLMRRNAAYLALTTVTLALWLYYGMWERQVLPFVLLGILLGAREAAPVISAAMQRSGIDARRASRYAVVGLTAGVALFSFALGDRPRGTEIFRQFGGSDVRYYRYRPGGKVPYSPQLVAALRTRRYVLTSGWWQFPELSARWNLQFYDRMAPENSALPVNEAALLFDPALAPHTTVDGNCRSVVYRDDDTVLCRPRADVPLNFQPAS